MIVCKRIDATLVAQMHHVEAFMWVSIHQDKRFYHEWNKLYLYVFRDGGFFSDEKDFNRKKKHPYLSVGVGFRTF